MAGAESLDQYLPALQGRTVALVVNHTSIFPTTGTHLADSLINLGIKVKLIFAPEHGFRGTADAGETIKNGFDVQTRLPVVSLYGENKKPRPDQLKGIDIIIFDIQDVGVRFYTYTSTMHYVMEAAAENNKVLIILDRPNPNGHYVDGPVLDRRLSSFVGLNPVPIVHGCTTGELAQMINGEGWLKGGRTCKLRIIKCKNYTHATEYELPVATSPNLPNQQSVWLYPSICLFEPTEISVGRGTDKQFQVIGGPSPAYGEFEFTPEDRPGANNPPNEGKLCNGLDLRKTNALKQQFTLKYLIDFYGKASNKVAFFTNPTFFDKLAGTTVLREQLVSGMNEIEIRASWEPALSDYKTIRQRYLLYDL